MKNRTWLSTNVSRRLKDMTFPQFSQCIWIYFYLFSSAIDSVQPDDLRSGWRPWKSDWLAWKSRRHQRMQSGGKYFQTFERLQNYGSISLCHASVTLQCNCNLHDLNDKIYFNYISKCELILHLLIHRKVSQPSTLQCIRGTRMSYKHSSTTEPMSICNLE